MCAGRGNVSRRLLTSAMVFSANGARLVTRRPWNALQAASSSALHSETDPNRRVETIVYPFGSSPLVWRAVRREVARHAGGSLVATRACVPSVFIVSSDLRRPEQVFQVG